MKTPGCWKLKGIILPNYTGITISQQKDPHKPTSTHRIHVGCIYLHLVDFDVGKYAIHGSYGV